MKYFHSLVGAINDSNITDILLLLFNNITDVIIYNNK